MADVVWTHDVRLAMSIRGRRRPRLFRRRPSRPLQDTKSDILVCDCASIRLRAVTTRVPSWNDLTRMAARDVLGIRIVGGERSRRWTGRGARWWAGGILGWNSGPLLICWRARYRRVYQGAADFRWAYWIDDSSNRWAGQRFVDIGVCGSHWGWRCRLDLC